MTNTPVVLARDLTKRFGARSAVSDLSFELPEGRITAFLGPNGAGKTTTLRMVLGLVQPSSGAALVRGRQYRDLDNPVRVVGAMLENSGAHPLRSGLAHLRLQCAAAGLHRSRAFELIEFVGLSGAADLMFGEYSQGMRQRLNVAQALLGDPSILVLDEPGNGLDPQGTVWLRELLRRLADEGRTVLLSSHAIGEVDQIADNYVIIDHGALVMCGPRSSVVKRVPQVSAVRVRVSAPAVLIDAVNRAGGHAHRVAPHDHIVVSGLTPGAIAGLATSAGLELSELVVIEPTLEQAFLHAVQGREVT